MLSMHSMHGFLLLLFRPWRLARCPAQSKAYRQNEPKLRSVTCRQHAITVSACTRRLNLAFSPGGSEMCLPAVPLGHGGSVYTGLDSMGRSLVSKLAVSAVQYLPGDQVQEESEIRSGAVRQWCSACGLLMQVMPVDFPHTRQPASSFFLLQASSIAWAFTPARASLLACRLYSC